MQTLNVGAGRTDEEYKAAEEQRRADLLADSQSDAMYFFIAAGLAGLGTGLLPLRLNVLVNIGVMDLLPYYGGELVRLHPLLLYAAAATWVATLIGLGLAARRGHRWAFLAGLVLYGVDMLALALAMSFFAFGVHVLFVYRWFRGQKALKDVKESK